ncbi:hypothetical protein Q5752_001124 [Cryptotrichosporon argae]
MRPFATPAAVAVLSLLAVTAAAPWPLSRKSTQGLKMRTRGAAASRNATRGSRSAAHVAGWARDDTTYTPEGTAYQGSGQVLYEISGVVGTTYYDISESTDGDPCGAGGVVGYDGWAVSEGINGGIPECSYISGKTLDELGSAQIVAIDNRLFGGEHADVENLAYWCGKEVQVFNSEGTQIVMDVGPFYLWDGCLECTQVNRMDFSASGLTAVSGGTCGTTNAAGLTYRVIDNQIVEPESTTASTPYSTSLALTAGEYSGADATVTAVPAAASLLGLSTTTLAMSGITAVAGASSAYAGEVTGAVVGSSADNTATTATATGSNDMATTATAASASATSAVGSPAETSEAGSSAASSSATLGLSDAYEVKAVVGSSSSAGDGAAATTSTAAISSASSTSSASSGGDGCTAADYKCEGLNLYICGYGTSGSDDLSWLEASQCPTTCTVDGTTVDCT